MSDLHFEKRYASAIDVGNTQLFGIVIGDQEIMTVMQWVIVYFLMGLLLTVPWARDFQRYMASAKAVDTGDKFEDAERELFRDGFRKIMSEGQSGSKLVYSLAFIGVFVSTATVWPLILVLFGIPKIHGK